MSKASALAKAIKSAAKRMSKQNRRVFDSRVNEFLNPDGTLQYTRLRSTDPELHKELQRERMREYYRNMKETNPKKYNEYKKSRRMYRTRKYKGDPEYRKRHLKSSRNFMERWRKTPKGLKITRKHSLKYQRKMLKDEAYIERKRIYNHLYQLQKASEKRGKN